MEITLFDNVMNSEHTSERGLQRTLNSTSSSHNEESMSAESIYRVGASDGQRKCESI